MNIENINYITREEDMNSEKKAENVFGDYKKEVEITIKNAQEKVSREKEREYFSFNKYSVGKLNSEVRKAVEKASGISVSPGFKIDVPPVNIKGDFAVECFGLAKQLGRKPIELAQEIATIINDGDSGLIESANLAGPFVNLDIKKDKVYAEVLSEIGEMGDKYGESDLNAGKVAIVDYSAPNIAKPIGVGHLRSTVIGQAVSNLYQKTGFSVVRDNHLGDWGTQFGSLIYAVEQWGEESGKKEETEKSIGELKDLYVKFHKLAEDNPEIKEKARAIFAQLEQGDSRLLGIWKKFRDLSISDFDKTYQKLGVSFDTYVGESYFNDSTDRVIKDCFAKGLCKKDTETGSVVVDSLEGIPSFLLQKQDGSSLYATRDLAALRFRMEMFKPDLISYVVGSEQSLYFKQLFELGRAMNYLPPEVDVKHIDFGMVLREGKKMSTRKGTLIELDDLIGQSIDKSKEILAEKNPDLGPNELDEISKTVGIGAIIYNDLRQSRTTNISFDWDKMLNFEAGSAVYLQYTYVRIKSILRKTEEVYGGEEETPFDPKSVFVFEKESEFALAKKLMLFPQIIANSQRLDAPHLICGYLEELAQLFNGFYGEVSIVKTEKSELRKSRVMLIKSVATVIKNGLSLLSIKVPEKM